MITVHRPGNWTGHKTKQMEVEELRQTFDEEVESLFRKGATGTYERVEVEEVQDKDEVMILKRLRGG
ncbi:MAG: hypothetical protein ACE5JP_13765 [Candidatus Bipolaricaulia bacterium]